MNGLDYYTDGGITKRIKDEMTYRQAENVKLWRIEFGNTYERIAEMWCESYRSWQNSDGLGEKLCNHAARMLHENPSDWEVNKQ